MNLYRKKNVNKGICLLFQEKGDKSLKYCGFFDVPKLFTNGGSGKNYFGAYHLFLGIAEM